MRPWHFGGAYSSSSGSLITAGSRSSSSSSSSSSSPLLGSRGGIVLPTRFNQAKRSSGKLGVIMSSVQRRLVLSRRTFEQLAQPVRRVFLHLNQIDGLDASIAIIDVTCSTASRQGAMSACTCWSRLSVRVKVARPLVDEQDIRTTSISTTFHQHARTLSDNNLGHSRVFHFEEGFR